MKTNVIMPISTCNSLKRKLTELMQHKFFFVCNLNKIFRIGTFTELNASCLLFDFTSDFDYFQLPQTDINDVLKIMTSKVLNLKISFNCFVSLVPVVGLEPTRF